MKKEITFCDFCSQPILENQRYIILVIDETSDEKLVHTTCFVERAYELEPEEVEFKIETIN